MNFVEFSKVDNNKIIAIINDKIALNQGKDHLNITFSEKALGFEDRDCLGSVSFSHDSQHVGWKSFTKYNIL